MRGPDRAERFWGLNPTATGLPAASESESESERERERERETTTEGEGTHWGGLGPPASSAGRRGPWWG